MCLQALSPFNRVGNDKILRFFLRGPHSPEMGQRGASSIAVDWHEVLVDAGPWNISGLVPPSINDNEALCVKHGTFLGC